VDRSGHEVSMRVQKINAYYCRRCEVSGMLDVTRVCWSCEQTDKLENATPFVLSGSSQREGAPSWSAVQIPSVNFPATFAARFGGGSTTPSAP